MAMKKRKLVSKSKSKPVRKTGAQKTAAARAYRGRKNATKRANKAYYNKNRNQILKRAALRRARVKRGDTRTTRRASLGVTTRRKAAPRRGAR